MFRIEPAERIANLPPYLFAEIDRLIQEVKSKGTDIIDFGVGDPDLPTPKPIINTMKMEVEASENHSYPSYEGLLQFRESVAGWYKRRFNVDLDPITEVISLIGSKEGIAHIPLAFTNPGDFNLAPDPAYPVYNIATLFAGGQTFFMPLLKENGFLPDLTTIPREVAKNTKLMFLNYPNNPTAAVADEKFFLKVIDFARENNIIVCHDAAYTEMSYDGYRPISFFEVEGAKEVGIEFHSLSKTYNMTGWRIGFAVGNEKVISGLSKVKTNIDSGVFKAIQYAGIEALEGNRSCIDNMQKVYQERRDILVNGLKGLGLNVEPPKATFYLWFDVPKGYTSQDFATHLLSNAGIVITPGNGFGKYGEGYARISMTVDKGRIGEALERIRKVGF
ncbi:MAG: LL-diaminopimelate aminotransferase [Thermodesulfobacteriota bacterium]